MTDETSGSWDADGSDAAGALVAEIVSAVGAGDPGIVRLLLHPYLHWTEHGLTTRGRTNVLALLAGRVELAEPVRVELRDGQIYRWVGDD